MANNLSNLEVVAAANYLDELDASFPIRSGTRVSRSKKALQEEAEFIQEQQQEVNEKHQAENEEGEKLFNVFVPGEDEPRELTQDEAQDLAQEDDIDQNGLRMGQKWETPEERQEELNELMRDESGIDADGDLHEVLEEELDDIQNAFQGERVSDVITKIDQVLDLSESQKEQLEGVIAPALNDGVSLADLETIEFLMPVA